MNKMKVVTVLLMVLTLAACGNSGDSSTSSSTASKSTESLTSTSPTSESSTSSNASSDKSTPSSSESTPTSESSEEVSNTQQADAILKSLHESYPGVALPSAIFSENNDGTGVFLTAATTGASDQNHFRILYYAANQAITVNDPAVNSLVPIASFEKRTYASAAEAQQAVGQIEPSGVEVALGYRITGYSDAGAGNIHLGWREGNWSAFVHAVNIEGEDPLPLAKSAVAYLDTAFLPVPNTAGQISLEVTNGDYQRNSVTWQKDNVVFTVTHQEAMQALKMAVSVK